MPTVPTDRDLLARVHDELRERGASGTVVRTTVGDRLVVVELDGGRAGVAHRPPGEATVARPPDALELARLAVDPPPNGGRLDTALAIAALNALSATAIPWRRGDPMMAIETGVDRIATVGLFQPALRKFDAVDVRVVEREPVDDVDAPDGVSVSVHGPADHEAAFAGVDVLFVTGSSLVYGGTATYLRAAAAVPTVVLIGATASFLPGPAFQAGVTMLAGARVTDPVAVRAGVERGFCGTDLHDQGLEKVYVAAEATPRGLELDGEAFSGPGDGPG